LDSIRFFFILDLYRWACCKIVDRGYKKDLSFDSELLLCNIVQVFVFREIETQWIIIGKYKKINHLKEGKETKLWNLRGGEREKRRRKGIKGKLVANATTWINIRHTLPLMEDAI
jgi:hypothetical protein